MIKGKKINKKFCSYCKTNKGKIWFSKDYDDYLCARHYGQYFRTKTLWGKNRSTFDKNEIKKINDDTSAIILYNSKSEIVNKTIVDSKFVERISLHKWCLAKNGYAVSRIDGKLNYLHRFILKLKNSKISVDHKNGNRLDNRIKNIRIATQSENCMNRGIQSNNSTGYTGVHKLKNNKFVSGIKILGKTKHLGVFNKIEDAIVARKKAEKEYFGKYSFENSRKIKAS